MEPTVAGPAPPGRRTGIPLGRLFGFPLHLHWSVLLLVALILLLSGQVLGYRVGVGFVVALLGSVLLHELGHALTARRLGIGVRGITLEILGGYTEMTRDAPSPRAELLVSMAGPAVSAGLGVSAGGAALVLPGGALQQVAVLAALSNLVVALFNALPGLPLDGGRALRALVWWGSRDRQFGTVVAARCGQAVAVVTLAGAVGLYLAGIITVIGLALTLMVASGLWINAAGSVRAARMTGRLPMLDLDRLTRPIVTVATGTPLAEAQRRVAEAGDAAAELVVADSTGRLVALVHPDAAQAVPEHRRPWVPVDSVARQLTSIRTVPAGLRGEEALRALRAEPAREYVVTDDGRVVGVLRSADVTRLLRTGATGRAT